MKGDTHKVFLREDLLCEHYQRRSRPFLFWMNEGEQRGNRTEIEQIPSSTQLRVGPHGVKWRQCGGPARTIQQCQDSIYDHETIKDPPVSTHTPPFTPSSDNQSDVRSTGRPDPAPPPLRVPYQERPGDPVSLHHRDLHREPLMRRIAAPHKNVSPHGVSVLHRPPPPASARSGTR